MQIDSNPMFKNAIVHLLWIIAILLLSISALIIYTPDGTIIYSYLSFASAISSIVLAVVAIVYSMVSNRGFSESLAAIHASADSVRQETHDFKVASQKFLENAEELAGQISLVPSSVDRMSEIIGTKIDSLNISSSSSTSGESKHEVSVVDDYQGKSIGSVIALCILHWSGVRGSDVSLDGMYTVEHKSLANFIFGYLSSIKNFKVAGIQIEMIGQKMRVVNLGSLDLTSFVAQAIEADNKKFLELLLPAVKYFGMDSIQNDIEERLKKIAETSANSSKESGTSPAAAPSSTEHSTAE